ncbi:Uncharacterised protein [Chlamydia trachomatis]|nr:Uncharacterised protein [Chlamydia trachomatis]
MIFPATAWEVLFEVAVACVEEEEVDTVTLGAEAEFV